MIVFLDSGVLGLASSPRKEGEAFFCKEWIFKLIARSVLVISSDLCDYEVRRGLILASFQDGKTQGIKNLDDLHNFIDFLPISSEAFLLASQLWATSRRQGQPTSDPKTIDADVIISAQCQLLQEEYQGQNLIVATTNVNHLNRFINAQEWQNIIC